MENTSSGISVKASKKIFMAKSIMTKIRRFATYNFNNNGRYQRNFYEVFKITELSFKI